jgi:site-specific recombinase XerD
LDSTDRSSEKLVVIAGPPHPENARFLERMDARFADFIDYVTTGVNHSAQSVAWYRRSYAAYRKYVTEAQTLDGPSFEAHALGIEEWVRTIRRSGRVRDVTIASYWRGLRRFFKDVEQRDGVASPFVGLKQPGFRDAAPKALDGTACLRILDAARNYPWPVPHRDFKRALGTAVVAIMLYAGLRRGELVRLQLADAEGTTIRIVAGKGRFGGRDRAAYVSPDLQRILHDYLRERQRLGITAPEFFVSPRSKGPFTVDLLRKLLRRISEAAGVRFSAHMLRHSFVTHLLHSGVPLHLTQRLAGHRNLTTTLGYLRVFDSDLADAIRGLRFDPNAGVSGGSAKRKNARGQEAMWP